MNLRDKTMREFRCYSYEEEFPLWGLVVVEIIFFAIVYLAKTFLSEAAP